MSEYATFNDFFAVIDGCIKSQEYARGLELLDKEGVRFQEEEPVVIYLRSCLAARLNDKNRALQEIQNGLDKGYWWSENVMRKSPSWQPLQGDPDFERLAEINIAREKQEQGKGPQVFVKPPDGGFPPGKRVPMLVALHGNGDYAAHTLEGWDDVTRMDWMLAALQSSQVMGYHVYTWEDDEIINQEVPAQIEKLLEDYPVDVERSVLAGFSGGGMQALRLVMSGKVPFKRFLLLGPGSEPMTRIDDAAACMDEAARGGVRGAVLVGEHDEADIVEKVKWLVPALNEGGVPTYVEVLPGKGHAYPGDGGAALERVLEFLLEE
jgi:predicted esterase